MLANHQEIIYKPLIIPIFILVSKYYLDTCIWRDYFENRSDKFRPLGEWALELIKKVINENDLFVISDHVLKEFENIYSENELKRFFDIIPEKLIIKVVMNKKQVKETLELMKKFNVPFGDALHAILARDNNSILVTRDKHFLELQDIVKIKKPEELI